uniref:Uncharacterized protein n=1 Tax=viral metagenome TaxID=1070528 RepID=A0A6M3KKI9_9ZZZZ
MKTLLTIICSLFVLSAWCQTVTTTPIILANNDTVYKTVSTFGKGSVTVTEEVNAPAMDSAYVNRVIGNMQMDLEMNVQDSIMSIQRLEALRAKQIKYNLIKELFEE